MKTYSFTALIVALTGFIAIIAAVEAPRKPKREGTIHVLPRVEEMPRVANPLQF